MKIRALILIIPGLFPAAVSAAAGDTLAEISSFRDCPPAQNCPEMLNIPPAPDSVILGSPVDEIGRVDNEAQHRVRFKGFAIAKYETSVGEYLACVDARACPPPEWLDPTSSHHVTQGTGFYYRNLGAAITDPNQPIVGVSHANATTYAAWLARKTGRAYRLPSEREWEYAARAGNSTPYWWGAEPKNADGSARAHCRGCGSSADGKAAAGVATFAPNPWGLFNVHGNVWEWTADYYCDDYALGPDDGLARLSDDCPVKDSDDLRVFRGGSSFYGPDKMRAASRLRQFSSFRNFSVGFRVARSLDTNPAP
ncbi:MAG: formylglycine-generating enzyme family protein [Hyphomicrobium sp.]